MQGNKLIEPEGQAPAMGVDIDTLRQKVKNPV